MVGGGSVIDKRRKEVMKRKGWTVVRRADGGKVLGRPKDNCCVLELWRGKLSLTGLDMSTEICTTDKSTRNRRLFIHKSPAQRRQFPADGRA
jgi:hypothetical protein